MGQWLKRRPGYVGLAVAVCMLAAMLGVAFDRDLVGTLTEHGWGRTLQGIGGALTDIRCGVGGAVIDKRLDNFLRNGGFTDSPRLIEALGKAYPENLLDKKALQHTLSEAKYITCAPSASLRDASGHYINLIGFSGEDSGLSSYTLVSFAIFGINIRGLTFTYFVIACFSLGLFAACHIRNPGAMVALGLMATALYLSVASELFNFMMPAEFGFRPGIDIKDPRFLGTLAAVPLLHIIITWMQPSRRLTISDYTVLALQTAILAFVLRVRFPVIWTVLIPLLLWAISIAVPSLRGRGSVFRLSRWRSPRSFFMMASVYAVLCGIQLTTSYSYHPFYAMEQDIPRHTFWDCVLQSLEYNPEWDSRYGAWANHATGDEMPLAAVRAAIAQLPAEQQAQYLQPNGNPTRVAYEEFSRHVFLDVLSHDPAFVFRTFFVIKPLLILRGADTMYRALWAGLNGWQAAVPMVALLLLGWVTARDSHFLRLLLGLVPIAFLCALVALLPNWFGLVNELVMFDNFVWELFLICLVLVVSTALLVHFVKPAWQKTGTAVLTPISGNELIPTQIASRNK